MKNICVLSCVSAIFLLSAMASAQMPKPGPELKRLDYFVGTWTLQCDLKPNQFGPGGKVTEIEHFSWMDGGFFLVSQEDYTGSMGEGKGTSFMGYDAMAKTYTYDSFNTWGEAAHAKGTVSGNTWTWTSDTQMMGKPTQTRFTVQESAPDSYTFKFEMTGADGAWSTIMDGKATKNK